MKGTYCFSGSIIGFGVFVAGGCLWLLSGVIAVASVCCVFILLFPFLLFVLYFVWVLLGFCFSPFLYCLDRGWALNWTLLGGPSMSLYI